MRYSHVWKKIRLRYCVLKALVSGPKSEQELLYQICQFAEFLPIRNNKWKDGELAEAVKQTVKELKNELKIKERDILNTSTRERQIEWFLNQEWLLRTKLFKAEINRVRLLEAIALKKKAEQDRLQRNKEERERLAQMERISQEKSIKLNQVQLNATKSNAINDKSENSKSNSVVNGILSLVAVGSGLYMVGEIGDSLNKAFTFPVFLIICAVGFSIYYLTKGKEK
jgi:hypothetical protein